MSGKYMDFVPARPAVKPPKKPTEVVSEVQDVQVEAILVERKRPAGVPSGSAMPKFGVIEDFQPKFVKTDVKKRPLSSAPKMMKPETETAASAKAKTVKASVKESMKTERVLENAVKKAEKTTEDLEVVKIPKAPVKTSPFVNTDKVKKRPLSKNVYQKKVEVPVETPSGPVTIITKPEKDSKVGTVVAIILTIILGATAGTVAFLLLPK
ncbi:MAG: hypothetical protein Q4B29_02920 [Candidatus Saccharibacteria bacterium]|nr:hypothetical protein [Candidatus Saccharibacteria bacterium]